MRIHSKLYPCQPCRVHSQAKFMNFMKTLWPTHKPWKQWGRLKISMAMCVWPSINYLVLEQTWYALMKIGKIGVFLRWSKLCENGVIEIQCNLVIEIKCVLRNGKLSHPEISSSKPKQGNINRDLASTVRLWSIDLLIVRRWQVSTIERKYWAQRNCVITAQEQDILLRSASAKPTA